MPETSHLLPSLAIQEQLAIASERDGNVWRHRGSSGARWHRHAELEVNLCVAGHAQYLIGERRFALSRRSLLWLFPAQNHLLIETSPDFEMWIVVWKPGLIRAICRGESSQSLKGQTPDKTWIARLQNGDTTRLERAFENVAQLSDLDHFNAGLGFLLMECHAVWRSGDEVLAGRAVHPCVENAARILRDEALDVPQLAHRIGLSPGRLSRLFRAQIGVSVSQFRTQMALERFVRLYDGRNFSLTQAAIEAGFGSYAQFHRVFVAQQGCSPAQYRAHLRAIEAYNS